MNKIDKFLKKLITGDRVFILKVLNQIYSGNFENLHVKKLKGFKNKYRVRVGRIRIIFTKEREGIRIDKLDFRSDNTY
ncbi:MAG: type II toxin-antitoxin system RelE/ParE family toxin [Minisyncoccia bacterium]